jgi:hypothetical protein
MTVKQEQTMNTLSIGQNAPYANDDLIDALDSLVEELRRVAGMMVENPDHPEYQELQDHAIELQEAAHVVENWQMELSWSESAV